MEMELKRLLATQALENLKALENDCVRLMHGPNLTTGQLYGFQGKSGRAELRVRIQTDTRILATKNLFSDGMSKDIDITGRVGGLDKRGPARTIWGQEPGTGSGQRFGPPITRPRTYQAPNGKRTFHFAHETISGSTKEAIASVAQHDHYLQDEDKVPGLEALIAKEAQDRTDYVARDVVPTDEVGPMIFSNLGEVGDFAPSWKTVAKTAIRAAGPEKKPWLKVRPVRDDPFWQSVLQRNSLPSKVREQILADGSEWIDIETEEIEATLTALRGCGWHERGTADGSSGQRARVRADEIKYYAGSSPELQRRIVVEIPKELDTAAKRRVLEEFTNEFRRRDLPFVCVFHEADENNNPLNGHGHIDYHERPMRRFSSASPPAVPQSLMDAYKKSKAGYAAKGKPYPKNGKLKRQIELWGEAAANPQPEWEGMWEPDIVFHYKTDSGKKKTTHPFDRNVHNDTRGDGWIFDLKTKFASIVNEELRAVGSETQFHPGKLSEIGIDKESDVHLGPWQNWLEKQGYPTLDGNDNEQRQWDHQMRELLQQHPLAMQPTDAPTHTLRFVRDAAAMLRARLTSRARHIHFHAARRITADSERPQKHPKKLSGKEFKRTYDLMEDAQEHLQCAEILFDDYGSWLTEIESALARPTVAHLQPPVAIASANETETVKKAPTSGRDDTDAPTTDPARVDTVETQGTERDSASTTVPAAIDRQKVTTMLAWLGQKADSGPSGVPGEKSPVTADTDGKLAEGPDVDPSALSAPVPQQHSIRTQTADARDAETDEPAALPADLTSHISQQVQSSPKTGKAADRPAEVEDTGPSSSPGILPGAAANNCIIGGSQRDVSKGGPAPTNDRENTTSEPLLAADGQNSGFSREPQEHPVDPIEEELASERAPATPKGPQGKNSKNANGPVAQENHSTRRAVSADAPSNRTSSSISTPSKAEKSYGRGEETSRREESGPAINNSRHVALWRTLVDGPFMVERTGPAYGVPTHIRKKFSLSDSDIADPRFQRALAVIDFDQKAELAWLAAAATARSAELKSIDGKWTLAGMHKSGAERLLAKWSIEPNVAKALRFAAQTRTPTTGAVRSVAAQRRNRFMTIALNRTEAPSRSKTKERPNRPNLQAAIANGLGQGY